MITGRRTVEGLDVYPLPERAPVRLHLNEAPAGGIAGRWGGLLPDEIRSYPDCSRLEERLAGFMGLERGRVCLFNGSSEAILTVALAFVEPGATRVVISRPTFSLIPRYLTLAGALPRVVDVRDDLSFDIGGLEAAIGEGADMVVLASPDNPTGDEIPAAVLSGWASGHPRMLVVVDEAYADFTGRTSAVPGMPDNMLVLRTFSKAWGMAGLRLGAAAGNPELLGWMRRVRPPFSVNAAAVSCLDSILDTGAGDVVAGARAVVAARRRLARELAARGMLAREGSANFVLARPRRGAEALRRACLDRGMAVKVLSGHPLCEGLVRITACGPEEMDSLLEALDAPEVSG